MLARLLDAVARQEAHDRFTFSLVVVDNDAQESARPALQAAEPCELDYQVEPKQNIARARNRAVAASRGEYAAFIDDDEFPGPDWLRTLLSTAETTGADGVLGPVRPYFPVEAPEWVRQGGFYDRPEHETGAALVWKQCRTGNVLLNRAIFEGGAPPFREEFLSGEDQDFFRRTTEAGRRFVWCNEAAVHEEVPPVRWTRKFLLRRALMRGVFSRRNRPGDHAALAKAAVAVPCYLLMLPVGLASGQARFMKYSFNLCYFAGHLLAAAGINPIRQPYVTE